MSANRKKITDIIKYIIILIPIIIYFSYVYIYALNLPALDDYPAILHFLSYYSEAHGLEKILKIFVFHGEHRILSSRIIYILYHYVFGELNFRHISFIGNMQLVFVLLILIHFIKKALPNNWFLASVIASFAIFDIANWENADFTMASVQNYGVIFLFFLSIFLYSLNGKGYVFLAMLVQIICTNSSGNGVIAALFIALFNFFNNNNLKKYISLGTFLIFGPLYFLNYDPPPTGHPSTNIPEIIKYVFCFIGNYIYFNTKTIALFTGISVFSCFLLVIPYNRKKIIEGQLLPLICFIGFILCTICLTSVFRSNPDGYIASRYIIYPHLLLALLFILILVKFKNKKSIVLLAPSFTILTIVAYVINLPIGTTGFEGRHNSIKNSDYYYPDKKVAKIISDGACQLNIYCIEKHRNERP